MLSPKFGYVSNRVSKTDIILTTSYSATGTTGSWGVNGYVYTTSNYFKIDWGDGSTNTYYSGYYSHTYSSTNLTRTITIYSCDSTGTIKYGAINAFYEYSYNNVRTLDCSNQVRLTNLAASGPLTSVNLSGCVALTVATFGNLSNSLSTFDLSGISTSLTYLSLVNYKLSILNISNFNNLTTLSISNSSLSSLDLSNRPKTMSLSLVNTTITSFSTTGTNFNTINFNGSSAIASSFNFTNRTTLNTISCNNCGLSTLNVSGCSNLNTLDASNNSFTSLSGLTSAIYTLYINNCNFLTSLNVSSITNLSYLECSNNSLLTSLIFTSNNSNLYALYAYNNSSLTSLNLNPVVETLSNFDIGSNNLSSLSLDGWTGAAGKGRGYMYSNQLSAESLQDILAALGTPDGNKNYIDMSDNPGSCDIANSYIEDATTLGWYIYAC